MNKLIRSSIAFVAIISLLLTTSIVSAKEDDFSTKSSNIVIDSGYTEDGVYYEVFAPVVVPSNENSTDAVIDTRNYTATVWYYNVAWGYNPPTTYYYSGYPFGNMYRYSGTLKFKVGKIHAAGGNNYNLEANYTGKVSAVIN